MKNKISTTEVTSIKTRATYLYIVVLHIDTCLKDVAREGRSG